MLTLPKGDVVRQNPRGTVTLKAGAFTTPPTEARTSLQTTGETAAKKVAGGGGQGAGLQGGHGQIWISRQMTFFSSSSIAQVLERLLSKYETQNLHLVLLDGLEII